MYTAFKMVFFLKSLNKSFNHPIRILGAENNERIVFKCRFWKKKIRI